VNQRPNTRVQRTRSSPSALREPLTRHPLGSRELLRMLVLCLAIATCRQETTAPAPPAVGSARVESDKVLQTVMGHWATGHGPGDSGYSYFTPCGSQQKLWLKVPDEEPMRQRVLAALPSRETLAEPADQTYFLKAETRRNQLGGGPQTVMFLSRVIEIRAARSNDCESGPS
jgi:hypothetical protein